MPPRFEVRRPGRAERGHRADRRHGLRRARQLYWPGGDADAGQAGRGRAALQQLPHHRAVFADARARWSRRKPSPAEHGLHHRDGDGHARQHRPDPQLDGAAGRDAAAERLQHGGLRQSGTRTASWEISVSGPFDRWPLRQASTSSTASSGGETNQWAPLIYDGVTLVELPDDPNYHFMTDMTEKARAWIKHQRR